MAPQIADVLLKFFARVETLAKTASEKKRQGIALTPASPAPPAPAPTPPTPAVPLSFSNAPRTKKVFDWIRKQIPPITLNELDGNVLIDRKSGIVFDRPQISGLQLATGKISKAALKKSPPTEKIHIVLNRFNNYEHLATGLVFDQTLAIGWQNPVTGAIDDLSSTHLEYCNSHKIRYSLAKTYEKELAERRANAPPIEQDEDESESEDEDDLD